MTSAAFVNDGRWVAHCPTLECNGAEQVFEIRRVRGDGVSYGIYNGVLHCANCLQTSHVAFPTDRAGIDAVLTRRPVPQTRHWRDGETITDLIKENASHGVD